MTKVLVTGCEGDVGSVLLPQLARRFDAVGFDIRPHKGDLNVIQGDLTSYDEVLGAMQGVDAVAHVAALLCSSDQAASVDVNVKATANVLEAAVNCGVKRVVYCSTVWASGHGDTEPYQPIDEDVPCAPVCKYGLTKWFGEMVTEWYGREHGIETVVLRFCGFDGVKGYNDDGDIDWEQADLQRLFGRCFGGGFKLMNPFDLGEAFSLALEKPEVGGERFVVGVYTPYTAADAAGLASAPETVIEKYYPGTTAFLKDIGVEVHPVPFFFNHEKARTRMRFRSQHDLGDLVRLYKEWKS